jgi:hypothetical protein
VKTRPNTTAWPKIVVLDGDRDAMMVACSMSGRNGDRPVGRITERAGCPAEVAPATIIYSLTRSRGALEFMRASDTEVES